MAGNTLYGTTKAGGNQYGTVFKINTDGTGFTNLHIFSALEGSGTATNRDGAEPATGVIIVGNTLYGTTYMGGLYGNGGVFRVNTDGTGFTNLYSFAASGGVHPDGAVPSGLVALGDTLYGTMLEGGGQLRGTVFGINTDGTGFDTLYSFSSLVSKTNSDGSNPAASLALCDNLLYGTTMYGGSGSNGVLFSLDPNTLEFATLYDFSGSIRANGTVGSATAALTVCSSALYGTATGGSGTNGVLFSINTDGTGFTNLYSFTRCVSYTNSDGAIPQAGLVLSGDALYGMAEDGGCNGYGTLFRVHTDGTGFATLYSFTGQSDGAYPCGGLVLSGNTLYGTTSSGGTNGGGTIFALNLTAVSIPLNIQLAGGAAVLSWNDPAAAFSLQAAPCAGCAFTNVPGATSPYTNAITGSQQFFRLQSN